MCRAAESGGGREAGPADPEGAAGQHPHEGHAAHDDDPLNKSGTNK